MSLILTLIYITEIKNTLIFLFNHQTNCTPHAVRIDCPISDLLTNTRFPACKPFLNHPLFLSCTNAILQWLVESYINRLTEASVFSLDMSCFCS